MISNQERADRIRESFYGEVPSSWTFDHDDTDLAYPMVADEKNPPMLLINILIAIGGIAVVIALVYGVALAIDAGQAAW